MNFASDNVYGVDPRIMAALAEANGGTAASYGADELTRKAEAKLSEVFETQVCSYMVTTGTAANGLSLSAIAPPYGAIICHAEAHINCDECAAPEFFTGGAKLMGLAAPGGKITPPLIDKALKGFTRAEHDPKPAAVSITNATELGTVYSPEEVAAISALIRRRGMRLHMDGARFANAVAGLGVSPAELTWKSGVDVLSFGATKNGAMMLEAVVIFDPQLATDFVHRRMRAGQLVSKSRYLGAQMLAYLDGGLWLDNARRANALAVKLAAGFGKLRGIRLPNPVQANEVFVIMPRTIYDKLPALGVQCGTWMPDSLQAASASSREGRRTTTWLPDSLDASIAEHEIFVRFVTSYATPEDSVPRVIEVLGSLCQ